MIIDRGVADNKSATLVFPKLDRPIPWNLFQGTTMNPLKRFFDNEAGNATEYALIISLVSIAIAAGAVVLGTGLNNLYQAVGAALS